MSLSSAIALARSQIKREEGCELHAYPDPISLLGRACIAAKIPLTEHVTLKSILPGEPWTVGYGETGPYIGPNTVWTQEEAERALNAKITECITELDHNIPWWDKLGDARMAAIVSLVYQLGLAGLLRFHHAVAAIQAGDWVTASAELLASRWAAQTPARAKRIALQVLTGEAA